MNVYGCDDECSDIHGEEFPGQSEFHYEYNRSHTEENVRHICKNCGRTRRDLQSRYDYCEKHSWKNVSLIGDETVINLQRAKVNVFSDSVLCVGRVHQYPMSNEFWKDRIGWITTSRSYRDYDGISGEPTELEWNIFPGFTTLQLYGKVTDLLSRLRETPEIFTGRILFMSMFNDISCDKKDN